MSMRPRVKNPPPRPPRQQLEYEGIPPELWAVIFSFLSEEQDIKNITLVSRSFQTLAQPLLFHHVHFRPECVKSPTSGHLMCWHADLTRVVKRLTLFRRVSHGIHQINISPFIKYGRREERTIELGAIVDLIFRNLPSFAHLEALKCSQVILSPESLAQISSLPSFQSFKAVNCFINAPLAPDNAPVVMVRDLELFWGSMSENIIGETMTTSSHQYWLSFMHPNLLRSFNLLPLSLHLHRFIFDIAASGAIYLSLRSLKIPWYAVESPFFFDVLAQCPSLVELRLPVFPSHRGVVMEQPLPESFIPYLSILEAPDQALPSFLQNRPLQELSLGTLAEMGTEPEAIIAVLAQLSDVAKSVEKLTLHLSKVTQELLDALAERFPRLKCFEIVGNNLAWGPRAGSLGTRNIEDIVAMFLSIQLPLSLQYVCFGKEYNGLENAGWNVQVDSDDVLVLKSHFRFNYPALLEVHFCSLSIQMNWMNGKVTTAARPRENRLILPRRNSMTRGYQVQRPSSLGA